MPVMLQFLRGVPQLAAGRSMLPCHGVEPPAEESPRPANGIGPASAPAGSAANCASDVAWPDLPVHRGHVYLMIKLRKETN